MRAALPLVLLAAVLPVAAQTMYRSTMPDGRVVLSDRPMPGARKVQEIEPPRGNVAPGQLPGVPSPAGPAARPDLREARAAAEAELREAQRAFDAAREAKDKGIEPLPGERLGLAGGGSRLSDEYWRRQKALEDAVAAAEARLQAARERLNALR